MKHFSNLTYNAIFEILDPLYGGFQYFFGFLFAFSSIIYIGEVFKPVASIRDIKTVGYQHPTMELNLTDGLVVSEVFIEFGLFSQKWQKNKENKPSVFPP